MFIFAEFVMIAMAVILAALVLEKLVVPYIRGKRRTK
jgi:hypothetical protein